jgi:hypothetical protein
MGAYGDPVALVAVLDGSEASVDDAEEADEPAEPTPTDVIAVTVEVETRAAEPEAPAPVTEVPVAEAPVAIAVPAPPLAARHTSGAAIAADDDAWRAWALSLTAARGPQPLAAFERLFARDYMPLTNAIAQGLDEPRALHAHDEFRRTFSRAYADACPTFAVTGKRPKMVLDAPEVAARIARLHGARATQILMIDAMRFDVGGLVKDALRRALGARASLTDELILWSALPTTTARQLETLHRGADALRFTQVESERDVDPLRGRSSEVVRRVKIGSRDLYKLDAIEAKVRDAGAQALAALPQIAEGTAEVVARHAQTLKPRTLLFVFGDHGFTFDRGGIARQGGSSPEEVLVPAFAMLVGDVH